MPFLGLPARIDCMQFVAYHRDGLSVVEAESSSPSDGPNVVASLQDMQDSVKRFADLCGQDAGRSQSWSSYHRHKSTYLAWALLPSHQ